MTERKRGRPTAGRDSWEPQIAARIERKRRSRPLTSGGVWRGLGTMGLVGWSVAVPTLLGTGLGVYLDRHLPGKHSWTLALLVAGVLLGCALAWHWVHQEGRAIAKERGQKDD